MTARAISQNNLAESAVGAAVVVAAALVLLLVWLHGGKSGTAGYEVDARLAKVDGLGVGTDVRLAGIKVGSVADLTLDPRTYLVTVHMNIDPAVKIPADSSILVTSAGLLGSQYLSITPGGDDRMLAAGGMIENTQGSIDIMNLVGRFATGASTTNQPPPPPQNPGPGP